MQTDITLSDLNVQNVVVLKKKCRALLDLVEDEFDVRVKDDGNEHYQIVIYPYDSELGQQIDNPFHILYFNGSEPQWDRWVFYQHVYINPSEWEEYPDQCRSLKELGLNASKGRFTGYQYLSGGHREVFAAISIKSEYLSYNKFIYVGEKEHLGKKWMMLLNIRGYSNDWYVSYFLVNVVDRQVMDLNEEDAMYSATVHFSSFWLEDGHVFGYARCEPDIPQGMIKEVKYDSERYLFEEDYRTDDDLMGKRRFIAHVASQFALE